VFSRAWVRRILARYASIAPGEVPLETTSSGKPVWSRPARGVQLAFSVSHRQDLTLVAVSTAAAVGIDLEVLEEHAKYDAIAKMALSAAEWTKYELLAADERPAAVLRAWTRKEAVLKALGVGLGRPASSLEVTFLVDQPPLLLASEGVPCHWPLASWSPRPGWFAAVAVPQIEAEPRIEHFSATMLRDRYPSPAHLAAPLAHGS
jgi:4'-phosphopantetheinyl transferase